MPLPKFLKAFLFILLALFSCQHQQNRNVDKTITGITQLLNNGHFNSHPSVIRYSRHARCRMECRHITVKEIAEIIQHGKIDYRKSQLQADDCHKRYALEGNTDKNQYLRIIVAECNDVVTVITCIDLKEEWPCSCY
ncbi:DUF4258 domain-containing protein [Hydrotalea sp.]|uniref:DUF4258 domain-containing protein n=1 Tax=Hydrotalea sp. TaxID=2881279 RepID=UPI002638F3C4|nr:DUF4258 domain-containing protein [Hydrotalea sp.]